MPSGIGTQIQYVSFPQNLIPCMQGAEKRGRKQRMCPAVIHRHRIGCLYIREMEESQCPPGRKLEPVSVSHRKHRASDAKVGYVNGCRRMAENNHLRMQELFNIGQYSTDIRANLADDDVPD